MIYTSISSWKEVRTGTQAGQEAGALPDAEATEGAACWLVPRGLLSLLSRRTQNRHPEVAPPTEGWALLCHP